MNLRRLALLLLAAWPMTAGQAQHPDFEVKVSGQGRPVVFIPGLGNPGAIWDRVLAQLPSGVQAHVISIAGFGTVPPTGARPLLSKVRDELIVYIRKQNLQHPVIVGHSLGGFVALWTAIAAPDLPARLVIVDSPPFLPALGDPAATPETGRAQYAAVAGPLAQDSHAAFAQFMTGVVASTVTDPANAAWVTSLTTPSDPATCAEALMELATYDLRPDLGKIKCPALVLVAIADKGASQDAVLAKFRVQYEGLAGVRFTPFGKARHNIMVDDLPGFMKSLDGELATK
jgi:pimeloyl-ACP methyl ester carboxylesterase